MAGSWRLLRLARLILIACGLHFASDQPGAATANCSHAAFETLSKDRGEIGAPPWKATDLDTRGEMSQDWTSRRLLGAKDVAILPSSPPSQPALPPRVALPPATPAPHLAPYIPSPAKAPALAPLLPPVPALWHPAVAPAPSSPAFLEREAVLYFKGELTADPTGVFKLWNDTHNPNPCNWYGITCGRAGENAGRVTEIALPDRMLQGNLTRRIADLPFLEVLDLNGNLISGAFPDEIATLHHVRILRLGGNSFQSPFLYKLAACVTLQELALQGCAISDTFPAVVRNFSLLSVLNLGENQFTGPIPVWLGLLPSLRSLHLGGNAFTGDVPISLLNCTSLELLNISANLLTGSIDSTIGNLRELTAVNFSGNAFTGPVPESVANLTNLQSLDFSGNQLSGSLPEALGLLTSLKEINLSRNSIEGVIPSSLGLLPNLTLLDLSSNQLSGAIPDSIASMISLVELNVSWNDLQGRVPEALWQFAPDAFLGNPGLCGRVVARACPGDADVSPVGLHQRQGPRLVTFVGAAAEGCVLIVFAVLLIRYLAHRRRPAPAQSVVLFSKYFKALKLTVEEIQAATSSSAAEAASDGGGDHTLAGAFSRTLSGTLRRAVSGHIEKAVLPDGTVFAVKEWNIAKFAKKDRAKLDLEMVSFSRIRHRNVVRLMGYYLNQTSLAMLMEFMPNGNLDSHLHPPGQRSCQLKWSERLRIVMGVTTGLVYLHHETCENAVVHCDVKAGNVLLDSDMEPKLVDFGMAALVKRSNGATAASRVGSSGYAPPEYGFSSEFTRAGDVYSYGVLLLEIITGKRPTSEDVGAGVTLPAWVRSLKAQERERYAIDMALFRAADEPQINQILHILDAALLCTSYVPAARPSMLRVLGTLQEMPESVVEEELVPVEEDAPVDSSTSSLDQDNI